jgi:hypothetical protein
MAVQEDIHNIAECRTYRVRILLIQCIAVLGGQCLACGDIPPGHQPHGASREMHRTMRVAEMVDVPGFILERLPVDIPAGVEGQDRVIASGVSGDLKLY